MAFQRYLALDIGEKRIGVAVGTKFPQGLGMIQLTGDGTAALQTIEDFVEQEEVTAFVLGLPRVKSGTETSSATRARDWGKRLRDYFKLPVHFVDEALTSVAAETELRELGLNPKGVAAQVDERSAILILEQFLRESDVDHDVTKA